MEEIRGIPVINFNRICYYCLNKSEEGRDYKCKKGVNENLRTSAHIFCTKFKRNPKEKEYKFKGTLEDLGIMNLINLSEMETILTPLCIYSDGESARIGRQYLRDKNRLQIIEKLLKELETYKKIQNKSEARRIRKELRKRGFHLNKKRNKHESN